MDPNGKISFRQYPNAGEKDYAVDDFYLHPVIIEELKLTSRKRKEIKNAFEQRRDDWEERLFQLSEIPERKKRKAELDKLDEYQRTLDIQLAKRISSSLSNKQKKRLREIQLRFLIHQIGFYQTFGSEQIQKLLGTPSLKSEQFKQRQRDIAKSVYEKNRNLAKDAFNEWLDDFSEEKQKLFETRWGKILVQSTGAQQLILQLDPALKQTKFDPKNPFDISQNWPLFKHDVAGCCVQEKQTDSESKWTSVKKFRVAQMSFFSEHFRRDIEIVDEQVESLEILSAAYQKERWAINHELGKELGIVPRVFAAYKETPERVVYKFTTHE